MSLSFETLLVLGIAGFYLYDSAMLLYFNEVVFSNSFNRWTFALPGERWRLRGKLLHFPNPFLPFNGIFRLTWSPDSRISQHPQPDSAEEIARLVQPVGLMAILLFVEMCIVTPAIIFTHGAGTLFLIHLGVVYETILLSLVLVFLLRSRLSLSRKELASIAFDCLACPPFAINLVRKLTLRKSIPADPVRFGQSHLPPEQFNELIHGIKEKIKMEIEVTDDLAATQRLEAYHDQLPGIVK